MDRILAIPVRLLIAFLQAIPLTWAARLGRVGGALSGILDRRHRRIVFENLHRAFPHPPYRDRIPEIAREHFKRVGENYCCAIATSGMSWEALQPHVSFVSDQHIIDFLKTNPSRSVIAAIGHFGNFEVLARYAQFRPHVRGATTYRGLRQPAFDSLMMQLRKKSGCEFFERRRDGARLREALAKGGMFLGLLSDQHAGDRGLPLPFFGHIASTSAAPAVLALRYDSPLLVGICYRTALAQWRVEFGPFIPTTENGEPRTPEAIMTDVNARYEEAIRRDPPNWFWVHKRWKPGKHRPLSPNSTSNTSTPSQPPSTQAADDSIHSG